MPLRTFSRPIMKIENSISPVTPRETRLGPSSMRTIKQNAEIIIFLNLYRRLEMR